MRRVPLYLAASSMVAGTALLLAPPGAATATVPALSFGVPRIVDPVHVYGEPDIKVGPRHRATGRPGDVVVSGPQGTGVQRSVWNISRDNGDSWRVVQDLPQGAPAPTPGKSTNGPGGGDTEVAIDHTGKTYYSDLYALQCFTAAVTPDSGRTVRSTPKGCSHPEADRQWYGLLDPKPSDGSTAPYYLAHKNAAGVLAHPLLYLSYNDITNGAQLDKSADGLNFTPAGKDPNLNTGSPPGVYGDGEGGNYVADGNIVVDQRTGSVLAAVNHSEPNKPNGLALAVGTPDVNGDVTFTYKPIVTGLAGSPDLLFPVLAQDRARNLYTVWIEDCGIAGATCYHVFYSYASAASGWTQWSAPRRVDTPPAQTNVFPWVAAGADGIIDVVWYGTDRRENPSAKSDTNPKSWNVYMAQIAGANTAAPTIAQARVTPHPMHYNDICLLGSACVTGQGNRNLADFFEVTLDNGGRARIVYPDTSNGLIQPDFTPINGLFDHSGAAVVTVATQQTGLNAWTGQPLNAVETTGGRTGFTDPTGDSLVSKPLGGTYARGADITGVAVDARNGRLLLTVNTAGGSLASAASRAGAPYGQLVVRWQLGNRLYYAAIEQNALTGATTYYAGPTQSVDLCSVSACTPHYLVYPAPPAGGTTVTGSATVPASGGSTYRIAVPLSVVGSPRSGSRLEELAAYVFAAPQSASVKLTNVQAEAEQGVPLEIEGTRTINFTRFG